MEAPDGKQNPNNESKLEQSFSITFGFLFLNFYQNPNSELLEMTVHCSKLPKKIGFDIIDKGNFCCSVDC